jgi:TetR/AcrR family transcriptional regulator, repressor for uid operon
MSQVVIVGAGMAQATRERILDGAAQAVARHGLSKLEMTDVSAISGVSRGTLYRYFPDRDALLAAVAQREALRFKQRTLAAMAEAPPGPARLGVALEYATRHVREHAALQRLLETDPAFVLRAMREQFEGLKAEFSALLSPLLREIRLVKRRVVDVELLVDWLMRLMLSAYLLPHPHPEEMAHGLEAVYRILTADLTSRESVALRRARATSSLPERVRPAGAEAGRRRHSSEAGREALGRRTGVRARERK